LFLFWEDNRTGFQSEINFLHVNGDGIPGFRTDGKKVSSTEHSRTLPVSAAGPSGSAYVVWKELTRTSEQLMAQRVSSSGNLLWQQSGVQLTSPGDEIGAFSAASDERGNLFIPFIPKDANSDQDYVVKFNGFNSEGRKLFKEDISVSRSTNRKSMISCVADDSGGVYIFWLEVLNHNAVLTGQRIDKTGKLKWGNFPVVISGYRDNIFSFSAKKIASQVYLVWQTQKSDKDIYHQLISSDGKLLWDKVGVQVMPVKGHQTNPQPLIIKSQILLTWSDEQKNGDRNIAAQKFDIKGEPLWKKVLSIIDIKGEQFGQKILSDGKDGAIITWIDRRVSGARGNIYAQRIDKDGQLLWDSAGVAVASSKNTEKSYVSVVPDLTGGAVVIFKEKRNNKNEIYGQKIFNTGTFTSQVLAFNTELIGDSVKVSWYSANEVTGSSFNVERTTVTDTSSNAWEKIGEIRADGRAAAKYYEYYDKPHTSGTIYYRVVHSDQTGNIQPSDLAEINYLGDNTGVFVAQNYPNPFNEKTNISVYLPFASKVKLEFFNSHLEKINEMEEKLSAGQHNIEFSASGLKPGIYFYKVHADDFVEVKKMVVTR
jgi:hypothetical protein